jgi:hypothetical protein
MREHISSPCWLAGNIELCKDAKCKISKQAARGQILKCNAYKILQNGGDNGHDGKYTEWDRKISENH